MLDSILPSLIREDRECGKGWKGSKPPGCWRGKNPPKHLRGKGESSRTKKAAKVKAPKRSKDSGILQRELKNGAITQLFVTEPVGAKANVEVSTRIRGTNRNSSSVGRAVVSMMKSIAKGRDMQVLWVGNDNEAVAAALKKAGFRDRKVRDRSVLEAAVVDGKIQSTRG